MKQLIDIAHCYFCDGCGKVLDSTSHKEVKCDTCNGTGHTLRFTDYNED